MVRRQLAPEHHPARLLVQFVGDLDGYVHWLQQSDGAMAARAKTGGTVKAQPIVADGVLLVQNVEGKLTPVIFDKIHTQRQVPQSRADVKQIFVDNGVPAEEFDGAVDSFAVSGMVSQFDRNTESYNIRGVPAFLVNGKYLVKIESITSQEQFNQLVKFLLAKKD